jgi:hypothetical protein
VDKQIMQYSYIDGDDHVFMNMVRIRGRGRGRGRGRVRGRPRLHEHG